MVLTKVRSRGRYFAKRLPPSASWTRSRGSSGSSGVVTLKTDESIVRKLPFAVLLLKISVNRRGLGVLSESQQGVRKATGRLLGIAAIMSTQRSYVCFAFLKS